ncbi:MFS transporter [Paenarthrobacter sp. NPDC089989]|uniref:MFS transporter n=1 Tax=unclassified Paenarthrobacter TaxID=2634190 RepID=UPI00381C94A3
MTSSVKPDQTKNRTTPAQASAFPLMGLMTLALAIFLSMATEFLPGGLIPHIATEFGRSPAEVGNLITVFALTVIITAAPLTVLTRRVPRKAMVLISFSLIGAGNLGTTFAPTFEMLLAARALGALAHGAFWSVVAAYPAGLVRPGELGKATAVTAAGGSISGLVGIPLGNALGQAFGWRSSFAVLAGLILLVLVLMAWKLPAVAISRPKAAKSADNPRKEGLMPVLVVCLLIVLIVGAQTSFGTFNVVWLLDTVHMEPAVIPVMLFVGGAASALGVAVTGALFGRSPRRLFFGSVLVLILILASLPLATGSQPAVWLLSGVLGAVFGGVPVMLQTRMMLVASSQRRNMAAALQTTAFNVGIGGGAFLGGTAIELSGLNSLPQWAAATMTAALIAALAWELTHKTFNDRRRPGTWQ